MSCILWSLLQLCCKLNIDQMIVLQQNRGHSVERTPSPRHTEIGTVSLPARSGCIRVSEMAVVPVQPHTCTADLFYIIYAKPSSRSVAAFTTDCCLEYVLPDHFQSVINCPAVNNIPKLRLSRKICTILGYFFANKKTEIDRYVLRYDTIRDAILTCARKPT